jgi:hypothetical protein
MAGRARPGGAVVALEYSHADIVWEPEPPAAVRRFYDAFLAWRAAHGWDNRLGHRLPALFADAGLLGVEKSVEDEVATRDAPGFGDAVGIWLSVMRDTGPLIVASGELRADDLDAAAAAHRVWSERDAQRQQMVLRAVVGRRAGATA